MTTVIVSCFVILTIALWVAGAFAPTACPNCGSSDTYVVSDWSTVVRDCRTCGYAWERPS